MNKTGDWFSELANSDCTRQKYGILLWNNGRTASTLVWSSAVNWETWRHCAITLEWAIITCYTSISISRLIEVNVELTHCLGKASSPTRETQKPADIAVAFAFGNPKRSLLIISILLSDSQKIFDGKKPISLTLKENYSLLWNSRVLSSWYCDGERWGCGHKYFDLSCLQRVGHLFYIVGGWSTRNHAPFKYKLAGSKKMAYSRDSWLTDAVCRKHGNWIPNRIRAKQGYCLSCRESQIAYESSWDMSGMALHLVISNSFFGGSIHKPR